MVADILKVSHGEIKSRTPLMDLGFDSQTALTLRQRLGSTLNREFPPTLLFNYPTIEALVGHILGETPGSDALLAPGLNTVREKIAVIGMACRFPGARAPVELAALLRDKRDMTSEVLRHS